MATWTEDERLSALRQHNVLDTAPEEAFEEIVKAAAQALDAPMAAVSLVDEARQWFKAKLGLAVSETPRDVSFCAHAIQGEGLFVVPDATLDPRFMANALVTDDPALRFYAGAVIRTDDGMPLGALCVLDTKPRPKGVSAEQAKVLQVLAGQVSEQLRLRRLARDQAGIIAASLGREDRLLRALQSGAVGWWDWDVERNLVVGNADLARDFGMSPKLAAEGAPIEDFLANVHALDRPALAAALQDAVETGAPFREDYRLTHPGGRLLWVSARGSCLHDDQGKPTFFAGVIIDITDRKVAEDRLREADLGREIAMNVAELGSWDHNPSTGRRRYDARALEMLGLDAEAGADEEKTYAVVHPEDRERIRQASHAAISPGRVGPYRETFRIIDPRSGRVRWLSAVGRSEFQNQVCTRFIGVLNDVTEAREAQEHRQLLTNELNHRVKNTMAMVASIVDASLRSAESTAAARHDVAARLSSLGKAHDLLTAQSWTSADVAAVVASVVDAISVPDGRMEIKGPAVLLGPKLALQLSLALHELGTNAVKYGALSNDTGRIRIEWAVDGEGAARSFKFLWAERGGPTVVPPNRRGFGTRLIEVATASEFQGESRLDYAPAGLRWTLSAPFEGMEEQGRASAERP